MASHFTTTGRLPEPRSGSRGQGLVEFALIIPVMLLMLLAVLVLGRGIYAYRVVSNCAREPARYGVIAPADTSGIQSVAQGAAVGLDPAQMTVDVDWQPDAEIIRVTVSYSFRVITPLVAQAMGRNPPNLASTATMYPGY